MISGEGLRARSTAGEGRLGSAAAVGQALLADRARFVAFCAFALMVALTGGSSRSDIPTLMVLRPLAILFLGYALLCSTRRQRRAVAAPVMIVVGLLLVALLQLIPLPVSIWSELPRRDTIAIASQLIGMESLSRPLTLDPNRTWNTLFALFVPLAAIGLTAVQSERYRSWIIPAMAIVALLSAGVGFLQAIGVPSLHFYRITHHGFPVGLFANKNHQAITLLWLMLLGCWIATTFDGRNSKSNLSLMMAVAQIILLFPLVVLTGSRAGLLLSVPTLALSAWLLHRAPATKIVMRRLGPRARLLVAAAAAAIALLLLTGFAVLAMSDRYTAMTRLFAVDPGQDLRWAYLPIMIQMGLDYLPFGSGFGSFEGAFQAYEPSETMRSRYMNLAHNDFLQLTIEAGVFALVIVFVALFWLGYTVLRMWRTFVSENQNLAILAGGSAAIWLAASLVDYPLRTPVAAVFAAVLTAYLSVRSYDVRRSA